MKIIKLFLLGMLVLISSCQNQDNKLTGEWYALNNMAVLTLDLRNDSTFVCNSAASSTMCFSGRYTIDPTVTPMTIDLLQVSNGMEAAGLMQVNGDGSMDICINFGAPGAVARPETIEGDPTALTMMTLHCTRDRAGVEKEAEGACKAPTDGSLAFERNKHLGRGINIESTLDGFESEYPVYRSIEEDVQSIAAAGFQSVRLPIRFSSHCAVEAPYLIDPDFMAKVDQIVDASLKNNLPIVLDMHYYPYISFAGQDSLISYEDNIKRLVSLWSQIAEHYSSYPDDMVYFDLMNEPNPALGTDGWNELVNQLIPAIRKSNPGKTMLVMTPSLGQHWTINYLNLPQEEENIIVEFHYYLPHLFTHQGLEFAMADGAYNIPWMGTDEEKAAIEHDLNYCAEWSRKNNRPVNMGEFGVYKNADPDSRARWIGYMHQAARAREISTHLWSFRDGFSIRNNETGEWDSSIISSINN